MTDQTPRTEAGRGLLAGIQQTSDRLDVALNALDYILAIEDEARTEALDVEVLEQAMWRTDAPCVHLVEDIAREYRAILAGETE